jgi:hypothetical protein
MNTAIPNSERIHSLSADCVSSTKRDLKEKSMVSATENSEFGIAVIRKLEKLPLDRYSYVVLD